MPEWVQTGSRRDQYRTCAYLVHSQSLEYGRNMALLLVVMIHTRAFLLLHIAPIIADKRLMPQRLDTSEGYTPPVEWY